MVGLSGHSTWSTCCCSSEDKEIFDPNPSYVDIFTKFDFTQASLSFLPFLAFSTFLTFFPLSSLVIKICSAIAKHFFLRGTQSLYAIPQDHPSFFLAFGPFWVPVADSPKPKLIKQTNNPIQRSELEETKQPTDPLHNEAFRIHSYHHPSSIIDS